MCRALSSGKVDGKNMRDLSGWHILGSYLLFVNIVAFFMMGIDKKRARKKEWRISEKVLFLSALAGGSAGSVFGMHLFHHKTKHWYFVWGMPLILMIQLILMGILIKYL